MSGSFRTLETAGDFGGDIPAQDALARVRPAVRSREGADSKRYLVFHYVLVAYLFMYVSRLPELVPWLRIGYLLMPILLVGLVMTDQAKVLLDVRTGRWLAAFTIWVAVCVPVSFWPGGSFRTLVGTAQSLLIVAFIVAFVRSMRDVMRAAIAIGLASGTIAILSFISSANIANRQGLGGSASLADPNFFALYLLVGTAMLCIVASQTSGWLRPCAIVLIPINLAAMARSGSRAGIAALAAGVVLFLIYASAKQRVVVLSACLAGALCGAFLLPQDITQRFTDWFAPGGFRVLTTGRTTPSSEATGELTTAESSSEARMYLLRRSLIMTAKHPIFGVGPDQFQGAEAADASENGVRGAWHFTHNTYTQISSEMGIPGLLLFCAALFGSYRGLSAISRRGPTRYTRQTALFLQVGYFMLMLGAFFLSLGYGGLPFIMIGVVEAFKRSVARQIRESNVPRIRPEFSPAVQFSRVS